MNAQLGVVRKFAGIAAVAVIGLTFTPGAQAGLFDNAARKWAEGALRKLGATAASTGSHAMSSGMAKVAAKHGDEMVAVVRKMGPGAVKMVEEAGEHAPQVAKLLSRHGDDAAKYVLGRPAARKLFGRYGDDAADALVKHKDAAVPVLEVAGLSAAAALCKVSERNGRRLAMMAGGGELASIGSTPQVMGVLARYGDPAMEFLWKHKAVLASSAALAAFLHDPKPYIDGVNDITATAAGAPRQAK